MSVIARWDVTPGAPGDPAARRGRLEGLCAGLERDGTLIAWLDPAHTAGDADTVDEADESDRRPGALAPTFGPELDPARKIAATCRTLGGAVAVTLYLDDRPVRALCCSRRHAGALVRREVLFDPRVLERLSAVEVHDEALDAESLAVIAHPGQTPDAALAGLTRPVRLGDVDLADFGVIGGGVRDDTAALQDAFDFIKARGGVLRDRRGLPLRCGGLDLAGGVRPWAFEGTPGRTTFIRRDAATGAVLRCRGSDVPFQLSGFVIDGLASMYAGGGDGVTISDASGVRISGVTVVDYRHAAIDIDSSDPVRFGDCVLEDCHADGGGLAEAGLRLRAVSGSGFRRCSVRGIGGGQGVGLSLAGCGDAFVEESRAEGCRVGLALGRERGVAVRAASVTGFMATRCGAGFVAAFARRCAIDGLFVDMRGAGFDAIDLDRCVHTVLHATVVGVGPPAAAVRLRDGSTDNRLRLDGPGPSDRIAIFEPGARRNTVRVVRGDGIAAGPVGGDNVVVALGPGGAVRPGA